MYKMVIYNSIILILVICTIRVACWHNFITDQTSRDMMCKWDEVEFKISTQNVQSCVWECSKKQGCNGAIFYQGNMTCFGLKTDKPTLNQTGLPGAVFYKRVASMASQPSTPLASTTTTGQTTAPQTSTTTTSQTTTRTAGTTSAAQTTAPTTTTTTTPVTTTTTEAYPMPMLAGVSDSQLTADASFSGYEPHNARLHNSGCWRIYPSTDHYIEVNFQRWVSITAVTTQGCSAQNNWVTTYKVLTSQECLAFTEVQGGELFVGNTDASTPVTNTFDAPITARCLRINPQSVCAVSMASISLRFDVSGLTL